MKLNLCNTADGVQFNIITKNYILGFYSTNKVGML